MSDNVKNEKVIPFWKIIYKRLKLIILVTLSFALLGLAYGLLFVKTEYTVTTSLILKLEANDITAGENRNNASLTLLYFRPIKELVDPKVINKANESLPKDKQVNAGSFEMNYGEKSMIFTMSYTDYDVNVAKEKLAKIIETYKEFVSNKIMIQAENAEIVELQDGYDESSHSGLASTIVIVGAIGLVVGVGLAFLIYFLDNTAKDKEEIEELTGTTVIANIENQ
jgi:capsular polysaccharide biosynthesis protein